jgi:two-component system CheB/CheR fusion protein
MPVELVRDGVDLRPDHVYVAPPGKNVAVVHRRLETSESMQGNGIRLPFDYFLASLSADLGERAVCVVLSGTGSDGTVGLRAVKERGGLCIAQDAASAKYAGMPLSAAATGLMDHVLSPARMFAQIELEIRASRERIAEPSADPEFEDALRKVFATLQGRTGHDFRDYKVKTIRRRVERRMRTHLLEDPVDYVRMLQSNPHEVDLLFRELLIGVTSFFRDRVAFEALDAALKKTIARKDDDDVLRVWVPGCSTGEEAYSIGILLAEANTRFRKRLSVRIFATDLDAAAIEIARAGSYPADVIDDLGPERARRFFDSDGKRRRVKSEIRETVVFALQNVAKDPPFTKLDLISCRNLLIYFNSDLQKRLVPVFHYALNPGGVLFLGTSETPGMFDRLFFPIDRKCRLYERKPAALGAGVPPPSLARDIRVTAPLIVRRPEARRPIGAEGSHDERKATNEDLQSMNEELQSANEELETSGEELQSLNEELETVNAEYQTKMEELSRANDDMQNLLNGTDIATLFLDGDLKIKRFTEQAREFIGVVAGDIGRPVGDLVSHLRYDSLSADARRVVETVVPYELEVQTEAGKWRLLRILPYKTSHNVIDGVVVTVLDVDRVKRAELLAASRALAQSIVQTVREPLVVLNPALEIVSANRAFLALFGVTEAEVDGRPLFAVGDGFFSLPRLRNLLEDIVGQGSAFQDLQVDHAFSTAERQHVLLTARRLENETTPTAHVLLALNVVSGHELA